MANRSRHALRVAAVVAVAAVVGVMILVGVQLRTQHVTAEGARHPSRPSGEVGVPRDEGDFRRFKLGSIDGERLTPNRTDFAARTVDDGPLLLFLPATGAEPANYQLFLSTALSSGYHVLGLDYWNLGKTLSGTCGRDPHCYTQFQRNRFNGSFPSEVSDVSAGGSILSRLRNAIKHLEGVDPAGGWDRYMRGDDDVQWQNIVVAGHSQGGGEAAYIAHVRSVAGALMFSSPVESDGPFHAAWMDHPGKTPPERMYAIDSVRDVFGPKIWGAWEVMGLDGADGPWRTLTAAPSGKQDPHAILTTLPFGDPGQSHSLSIDDRTPLTDRGVPRMLPLWHWMLTRFPLPDTHATASDPDETPAPSPTATTAAEATPMPSSAGS